MTACPVDTVPLHVVVGGRTYVLRRSHLLSFLSVLQAISSRKTMWKSACFRNRTMSPLSAHSLSAPLQGGLRLLHTPVPAFLWASLAGRFPVTGKNTGLPRSADVTLMG